MHDLEQAIYILHPLYFSHIKPQLYIYTYFTIVMYHGKMKNDINFIKNSTENTKVQMYNTHFKVHDVVDIYFWLVRETKKVIINLFIYLFLSENITIH